MKRMTWAQHFVSADGDSFTTQDVEREAEAARERVFAEIARLDLRYSVTELNDKR
jgi:hypothetical protein